jgi:tRNA modification GTPase
MLTVILDDTIAAIASPPGPADRGIIRISGPRALEIAQALFHHPRPAAAGHGDRPRATIGEIRLPRLRWPLDALLFEWPSDRSYTGGPTAEIHTVGAPPILDHALAVCVERGARLAEPGEFTLRAFLAGKIDLTQAEAVIGVIDANSEIQLTMALEQLAGGVGQPLAQLSDALLDALAHLEASLDFVDEADVDPIRLNALRDQVLAGRSQIERIAARLDARDCPEAIARVVLAGPANAGKSRLFNALADAEAAIVAPIAGTTRDYLTTRIEIDHMTVELADTAGFDSAEIDGPAASARALSDAQIARADLVVLCQSIDAPLLNDAIDDGRSIQIWTKSDLAPPPDDGLWIRCSALSGEGLDSLRTAMGRALRERRGDRSMSTGARCRESLITAAASLKRAAEAIDARASEDLIAIDLREAIDHLGRVIGRVYTDDILDRIFSRFCIGK